MLTFRATADIRAAADKPPRVEIVAYSGGVMRPGGMGSTVVDLAGLALAPIPLLADHENRLAGIAGSGAPTVENHQLLVRGTLASGTAAAEQILALHRSGVRLQASIGAEIEASKFVDKGKRITANGRTFVAPADGLTLVSKSSLREVSIVAAGADAQTSVAIAAAKRRKGKAMNQDFQTWVANVAPTADQSDPDVLAGLHANYHGRDTATDADRSAVAPFLTASLDDEELRLRRVERSLAREERLSRLEATIPLAHTVPASRRQSPDADVLTAALCLQGGLTAAEKQFSERTLDAADRLSRGLTLQTLLMQAAVSGGYSARPGEAISDGNLRAVLSAVFAPDIRAQGWSTVAISNVVSNVANKFLLDGFTEMGDEWKSISAVKPVKNFKPATFVRLLDSLEFEQLGAAGEIKHGTLGDATMTAKADTYAKMLAITRQQIINDDLGALTDGPRRLGRAAGMKFRRLFWTKFLAADSFFDAANGNVLTGAGTALESTGAALTAALVAFRGQRTPAADGAKLIGGAPSVMLVPPALEITARRLLNSANIVAGSAADSQGSGNPFFGLCTLVVADWLGTLGGLANADDAQWYLLRAPSLAPAMLVAALNGKVEPNVDTAEADFGTLGIQMRGYSDVGADRGEPLCGLQMAGTPA